MALFTLAVIAASSVNSPAERCCWDSFGPAQPAPSAAARPSAPATRSLFIPASPRRGRSASARAPAPRAAAPARDRRAASGRRASGPRASGPAGAFAPYPWVVSGLKAYRLHEPCHCREQRDRLYGLGELRVVARRRGAAARLRLGGDGERSRGHAAAALGRQ